MAAKKLRAVVYLENNEKQSLKDFAKSRDLSMTETGRLAIEEYIKRRHMDWNRVRKHPWNRPRLVA